MVLAGNADAVLVLPVGTLAALLSCAPKVAV
jgi:hypothetical protein